MKIKKDFIQGKEENFYNFIDDLKFKDKVGIITHTDLDGISSAIILKKILEKKNVKIESLVFCDIKKDMFKKIYQEFLLKKITKIFICDICIDPDYEGYLKLKGKFKVLSIDHHPTSNLDKDFIRTSSEDCTTLSLYCLSKKIADLESLKKLVCATIISEFSYVKKENFYFIKKLYSNISKRNIINSIPGQLSKKISYSLIYFENNKEKVFDLILKKNEKELTHFYKIVNKEINFYVKEYSKKEEFYSKNKIHFYYCEKSLKFNITSIISTITSLKKPEEIFIFCTEDRLDKNFLKLSLRNQKGNKNTNELIKKAVEGLENSSGGGHKKASAARFMKKDLNKVKRRMLYS